MWLPLLPVLLVVFESAALSETPSTPASFSGSASADGVRLLLTVPEGPVIDAPVDVGGPRAQIAVDSLGSNAAYAAFPDPGEFVVSLPGVVAGFSGLPALPNYPFFVYSDAGSKPEQKMGSGPYQLSASSGTTSTKASATAGLQTDAAGNVGLITSDASLTVQASTVVAKATSDVQALSVGPLSIAEVKSVATETLGDDHAVTPSTELQLTGVRIGGVPVAVGSEGLSVGDASHPLPVPPSLQELLVSAHIYVEVLTAQEFPGRVVSPALRITMPVEPASGMSSTAIITVGSATAALAGALDADAIVESSTYSGSTFPPLDSSTANAALTAGAQGSRPILSAGKGQVTLRSKPTTIGARERPVVLIGNFGTESSYLLVLAGAIVAWAVGQLIRVLGVGRRWTSTAG